MAKYLITGGAGFIGSHLAHAITAAGDDVVVLDNLSTGHAENLGPAQAAPGGLEFIEGDIRNIDTCRQAMKGVDYVLHQAARASVQRSMENPALSHEVNVTGGLNVLIAAKDAQVRRMVSASSSSVYGDRKPLDAAKHEQMEPMPMSPYAGNKVAMEQYCRVFYRAFGLETVSLRYFNVFGPRQDPGSAYAAVIPKFLFALKEGKAPIIFGDGKQSRDFTYIDNVVRANLAACTAPAAAGEAINVAAGCSYDLLHMVKVLCRLLGVDIAPQFDEPRPGDVLYSLADLTKARKILGYEVTVDFELGLERLVDLARQGKYLP